MKLIHIYNYFQYLLLLFNTYLIYKNKNKDKKYGMNFLVVNNLQLNLSSKFIL
jgi:hypothetical protein